MTLINKSDEVIEKLTATHGKGDIAYAYAFGYAWAYLTDEYRQKILDIVSQTK
jgi:hypothetical protein